MKLASEEVRVIERLRRTKDGKVTVVMENGRVRDVQAAPKSYPHKCGLTETEHKK